MSILRGLYQFSYIVPTFAKCFSKQECKRENTNGREYMIHIFYIILVSDFTRRSYNNNCLTEYDVHICTLIPHYRRFEIAERMLSDC